MLQRVRFSRVDNRAAYPPGRRGLSNVGSRLLRICARHPRPAQGERKRQQMTEGFTQLPTPRVANGLLTLHQTDEVLPSGALRSASTSVGKRKCTCMRSYRLPGMESTRWISSRVPRCFMGSVAQASCAVRVNFCLYATYFGIYFASFDSVRCLGLGVSQDIANRRSKPSLISWTTSP